MDKTKISYQGRKDALAHPISKTGEDNPSVCKLLHNFDQSIISYLRCLLNTQPLLRADWETLDFFQELSSRYLLRMTSRRKKAPTSESHKAALLKRLAKHLFVDQLRRIRAQKRDILRMRNFPEASLESSHLHETNHIERLVQLETVEAVRKNQVRKNGRFCDSIRWGTGG